MGKVIMSGKVPKLVAPSTGIALADMAEGSIVKLNENGSPAEFYVAKHDYESALNGAGRTLLVRKTNYVTNRIWTNSYFTEDDDRGTRTYTDSAIDSYMTGTYRKVLDTAVQAAISTTKIYYSYTSFVTRFGTDTYTVSVGTIERDVFALSAAEMGSTATTDGTKIPISDLLHDAASWLRSASKSSYNSAYLSTSAGGITTQVGAGGSGYRPAFTLPSTAVFDPDTLEFVEVA